VRLEGTCEGSVRSSNVYQKYLWGGKEVSAHVIRDRETHSRYVNTNDVGATGIKIQHRRPRAGERRGLVGVGLLHALKGHRRSASDNNGLGGVPHHKNWGIG